VIVVDSAGDEALSELVAALPCGVLVTSDIGLLPGAARNLGVERARGTFLAFTDADCVPRPDWLVKAEEALKDGVRLAGGCVGHILPLHPVAVVDNIMQFTDYLPGRPAGASDHLAGCNLALARKDFWALGGFRKDLIVGEDTIFVEAAAKHWPGAVCFVPVMAVDHLGRRGLAAFWRHHRRFGIYRALLGSRLKPVFRKRGQTWPGAMLFCLRRFGYFLLRAAQWDPISLPRFLLFSPFVAFGLAAYGTGFREGCRKVEENPNA